MDETIYTVFPKGYDKEYESSYMPQDFSTYEEAKECDNCTEIIAYSNGEYTNQGFWCNKCLEELEEEL